MTYTEECELLDEVYETFVISCYLAGLIDVKDFWVNKGKYFEHTWVKATKNGLTHTRKQIQIGLQLKLARKSLSKLQLKMDRNIEP